MFHPDQLQIRYLDDPEPASVVVEPRGCLVDGCPCKDARIVSRRIAAFHAAIARATGETADRVITPEPGWAWTTTNGVDA